MIRYICESRAKGFSLDLLVQPACHLAFFQDSIKLPAERFPTIIALVTIHFENNIDLRNADIHIVDQTRLGSVPKTPDVD